MCKIFNGLWFLIVWMVTSCGTATTTTEQVYVRITSAELAEMLKKSDGLQLIDVRTPEELSFGRIKGARHMDFYASDFTTQLETLDKSLPVAVYCAVGGRSAKAVEKLKELGFMKVYDLTGGMRGWQAEGYPVEK